MVCARIGIQVRFSLEILPEVLRDGRQTGRLECFDCWISGKNGIICHAARVERISIPTLVSAPDCGRHRRCDNPGDNCGVGHIAPTPQFRMSLVFLCFENLEVVFGPTNVFGVAGVQIGASDEGSDFFGEFIDGVEFARGLTARLNGIRIHPVQ